MNSKKITLNLIIGAVLMSLMIFAAQTSARENGKIVFESIFNGGGIFTINPDGTNRTLLANVGSFPKFSPDGNKIAFYGGGGINLMNADGSNQTVLTSTGNIGFGTLAWSPDGQRIAFTCDGICLVNADGRNLINISNNPADHSPDWSPDGSKIAFTRGNDNFFNYEIYVMNVDGSNQTRLTTNSLPDEGPVWSPDGTKLAIERYDDCFDIGNGEILCFASSIFTINAADGGNQTFLIGGDIFFDGGYASDPSWSPDGSKLAFRGYKNVANFIRAEIIVIDANGGSPINLTNTADVEEYYPDWGSVPSLVSPNRAAFDFDGDGRADLAVFRPSDRVWYLNQSTSGFSATQFGLSTDKIAPADYDGDGKTDIAVFRDGVWYWLNSSNGNFNAIHFGQAGDVPVPADYTGDGRAELAVYRGGTWFTLNLSNNQFNTVQFGIASDKAVPADFDGDGQTDYAVYRDGVWYLLRSMQGFTAFQFGIATDRPTVGDYDGDGTADAAVYRDGTWYLLQSSQGFAALNFGLATDIPAPADFDGDGKTDIAVYRNGTWYLSRSQQGFSAVQFGLANDAPVPAAFVP